MSIQPLGNRVLVVRHEADKETPGGIILPDSAKEKKQYHGTVLAVGPGAWNHDNQCREPMEVEAGEHIYFASYSGYEVEVDGETLVVLPEVDIMAKDVAE